MFKSYNSPVADPLLSFISPLSLLGDAPQHVLHRVGKRREPYNHKQVGQGAAQQSVVPIGLLEAGGGVSGAQRAVASVEGGDSVVAVLRVAVRNHVGEGEGTGTQLLLGLLFLLYLLEREGGMERD